jgi:hypothetical protein
MLPGLLVLVSWLSIIASALMAPFQARTRMEPHAAHQAGGPIASESVPDEISGGLVSRFSARPQRSAILSEPVVLGGFRERCTL